MMKKDAYVDPLKKLMLKARADAKKAKMQRKDLKDTIREVRSKKQENLKKPLDNNTGIQ